MINLLVIDSVPRGTIYLVDQLAHRVDEEGITISARVLGAITNIGKESRDIRSQEEVDREEVH